MTGQLDGKRILVTGGATGIGATAVAVLAAEGARLAATYHRTPPPAGGDVFWVQCDATQQSSVDAAFHDAIAALGGLDVLVHAAGLWHRGVPGHIDVDDVRHVMDTNFTSTVLANQAAASAMGTGGGRIINFGSSERVMGSPMSAIYAASKSAVASWTRSAAKTWAAQGITVNALAPAVETPGAQRLRDFLGPDLLPVIRTAARRVDSARGQAGRPGRRPGIDAGVHGWRRLAVHHRSAAGRRWRIDDAGFLADPVRRRTCAQGDDRAYFSP